MRHPLKELSILDKAQHQLELAEKLVAIKFTIEVLRILAKYKKNGFQAFYCGQKGDSFFCSKKSVNTPEGEATKGHGRNNGFL